MMSIFKKFIKVTFASCALSLACNSYAALSSSGAHRAVNPSAQANTNCTSQAGEWGLHKANIEQLWWILAISLEDIVSQCQSKSKIKEMSYNLYKYDDGSIQTHQFKDCRYLKRKIGQIQDTFKADYSDKIYKSKQVQWKEAKCSGALMAPTLNRDLPWKHAKTKAKTKAKTPASSN
jgi:hypothetical protein